MDLVYPYKRRSDESELRYSVRSAAAHLAFDRLVIVGDKPWTVKPDVLIKHQGPPGRYDNSCSKILKAAASAEVSERFVLMNDDFFILKPMRVVPSLYKDMLDDWLAAYPYKKTNSYYKLAERTRAVLDEGARFFGLHCPMVMEKTKVREMADRFDLPRTLMTRTLYGSYFNVKAERADDHKAHNAMGVARFAGEQWFSTSDGAARTEVFQLLMKRLFPKPCRFENVT